MMDKTSMLTSLGRKNHGPRDSEIPKCSSFGGKKIKLRGKLCSQKL